MSAAKRIMLCTSEGDVLFWGYSVARKTDAVSPAPEAPASEPERQPSRSGIFVKGSHAKTAT